MATHKASLVWDDEKHPIVHLAMSNRDELNDAAFLRQCVEFYQVSQAGANVQQLILERLAKIESILRGGVQVSSNTPQGIEDHTNEILDELLEQI